MKGGEQSSSPLLYPFLSPQPPRVAPLLILQLLQGPSSPWGGWDVPPALPMDMAVKGSRAKHCQRGLEHLGDPGPCSCELQPPPHGSQRLSRDSLRIIQLEFPWLSGTTAPEPGDCASALWFNSAKAWGVCCSTPNEMGRETEPCVSPGLAWGQTPHSIGRESF